MFVSFLSITLVGVAEEVVFCDGEFAKDVGQVEVERR